MAAKKTAAKKRTTKKAAPKKTPAKTSGKAITSRYSKTQILTEIAESTDLSRKDVGAVIDELSSLIERHIKKRACGEFVLPGMLKITTVKKPKRPARKNVPNPFNPGTFMDVAAKPASISVKVRPLKKLKEMAV